jgi:hypothetical protein
LHKDNLFTQIPAHRWFGFRRGVCPASGKPCREFTQNPVQGRFHVHAARIRGISPDRCTKTPLSCSPFVDFAGAGHKNRGVLFTAHAFCPTCAQKWGGFVHHLALRVRHFYQIMD